jgi:glycosyltransferase involved in cell wall biosynthesis
VSDGHNSGREAIAMRLALVHPYYATYGGSEKVDEVLGLMFPDAEAFALFSEKHATPESLQQRTIHPSFLQKVPRIGKVYRALFPLFPYAIENLDLRGYDLVISSDHGPAKGVLVDQESKHICYCHTPWRQLYDLYQTSMEKVPAALRPIFGLTAHYLRQWDFIAAQRVDYFLANSKYVQRRILKCYRRESQVVYPPVETSQGYLSQSPDTYYLSVGRLSHTKRLDILVHACNRLKRRLLISGVGPEAKRLKDMAGPTIEFLGRVPDTQLPELYANCRALLFAADEDFGIVPVEAQAYGRPVIAFGRGGSLETVRVGDPDGRSDTGAFFPDQTVNSVAEAIIGFEAIESHFVPLDIQRHARQFDTSVFVEQMKRVINRVLEDRR